MLKKVGIIVGGTVAVLVAASPLAFADTSRSPECSFTATADNSVEQDGRSTGSSDLLDVLGGPVTNNATVTNTQTQAPVDSCNNNETRTTETTEDNDQDNDVITETVEDSFNETD